jgi:hypothetical protein
VWRNVTSNRVVPQFAPRLSKIDFTGNPKKFRNRYNVVLLTIAGFSGLLFCGSAAWADNLYGRIRGTVKDPSGAAISSARITATNTATGVSTVVTSGAEGSYEFLQLIAPGTYTVSTEITGFRKFEATEIQLNVNQTYVQDIDLKLGTVAQTVTVSEAGVTPVETTSMELGQTVNETTIVNMPLNGRDFDQLQQLEPGVVAASDARGGLGHGNYATNGSQPDQNSYLINGMDNNDLLLNQVQVEPSIDAIAEFKMVTGTFNPEYGRNSGAIMNAVVKSGTNAFHGDAFDFYRDTSLNARNFFAPAPAKFHRNQFGGTIGGPIWKNHTFFFFSYEGDREFHPELSGECGCASPGDTPVLTSDERGGFFPDLATSAAVSPFPIVGESGLTYAAGTPYSAIFPTGHIPAADFDPIAVNLLKDVPLPNMGSDYQFNPVVALQNDQYLGRIDHTISAKDTMWFYGLWQRKHDRQDLPFFGATLPGFAQVDNQHWQQYVADWSHTFSGTALNETRVGYTRLNYAAVAPAAPVSPSSVGFTGIIPQQQGSDQGVPALSITGLFNLGFSQDGPQPRIDQTYEFTDNFSKIVGKHTMKFGFDMRRFELYNTVLFENNGSFTFGAAGPFSTGNTGADFLLGLPDNYFQASGDILNERAQEYYSYAQDQWKARNNLTITYGLGWSIDTPMVDNYHGNHAGVAFRPGQQSVVFSTAPLGYVFQGDPGVNAFGTTQWKDLGPRIGFAYSPNKGGWLTGGPGKTSIRGGWGIYYNRFSGEPAYETQGAPPYALKSLGFADTGLAGSPTFAAPFNGYATVGGVPTLVSTPNKFPYAPSATPDFTLTEPMSISVYDPNISIPYAENYSLTIERQIGASSVVSIGYVGAQGHRLLITHEINPGINPAGCAADPACVTNRTRQPALFPGNYAYPGNVIASIGDVSTVGNSSYNAFQATWNRQLSHGLQFLAAYTWSHALDDGSGFENTAFNGGGFGGFGNTRSIDPFDMRLRDYGSSIFDARHRFVISYVYQMPSMRHFHALQFLPAKFTDGWKMSGITTFQSGFPLDVVDSSLPSLTDSYYQFYCTIGFGCWDVPNVTGPITYSNPKTAPNNQWVSASAFTAAPIGTQGNAGRNILRGPGINNWDFAVMKETHFTESKYLELRFEFFNFFNHTQFDPSGISTDINNPTFGQEFAAREPRLIQLAGKFYF